MVLTREHYLREPQHKNPLDVSAARRNGDFVLEYHKEGQRWTS